MSFAAMLKAKKGSSAPSGSHALKKRHKGYGIFLIRMRFPSSRDYDTSTEYIQ